MRLSDIGKEEFCRKFNEVAAGSDKGWPDGVRDFLSGFDYPFEVSDSSKPGSAYLVVGKHRTSTIVTWEDTERWIAETATKIDEEDKEYENKIDDGRKFRDVFEPEE